MFFFYRAQRLCKSDDLIRNEWKVSERTKDEVLFCKKGAKMGTRAELETDGGGTEPEGHPSIGE